MTAEFFLFSQLQIEELSTVTCNGCGHIVKKEAGIPTLERWEQQDEDFRANLAP